MSYAAFYKVHLGGRAVQWADQRLLSCVGHHLVGGHGASLGPGGSEGGLAQESAR
jgi:hypothetical protein